MNECLTTPQHEKQIGYWVSEKGKCMKWLYQFEVTNINCHECVGNLWLGGEGGGGGGSEALNLSDIFH